MDNTTMVIAAGVLLAAYIWYKNQPTTVNAGQYPVSKDTILADKAKLVYECEQGNAAACAKLTELYDANYLPISG